MEIPSTLITSQSNSQVPSDNEDGSDEDQPDIELTPTKNQQVLEQKDEESKKLEIDTRNYIKELKEAFDAADTKHSGELCFDQWKNSSISRFIHNGKLTTEEFHKFFYKIDANANDFVSWDELATFLMKEMTSSKMFNNTDIAYFIHKFPMSETDRNQQHREMINEVGFSPRHEEYISISSDSIRFWSSKTLSLTRTITEPGSFNAMLIIGKQNVLAVTTRTRKLLFFELDSLRLLPAQLNASPSPKEIKTMSPQAARSILHVIKKSDIPLFNAPTCMCLYRSYSNGVEADKTIKFFIGDDQGFVEAFAFSVPMIRQGSDFRIMKLGKFRVHTDSISKIEYIDTMFCYASSSLDHTVRLWKFDIITKKFSEEQCFKDSQPILGFHFSRGQKLLITFGISRDAYVWSLLNQRKTFKLGGHYNQVIAITNFQTSFGVDYIITITNRKEFRVWDGINFRMVREWTDPTPQRPENRYSAFFFDDRKKCLITASASLSKWAEDVNLSTDTQVANTHIHQIIGCHYSDQFDQIVTIDSRSNFSVWNLGDGSRSSQHQEQSDSQVCSTTLDWGKRRLFTLTKKNFATIWNFNSGDAMAHPNISDSPTITSVIKCTTIAGRKLLIRGGWDKKIALYAESGPESFTYYRSYSGHTGDITAITSFSYGFVSGSANGEVISWTLDTSKPHTKVTLSPPCIIECLQARGKIVYCGDSFGNLIMLSIPKLAIIDQRSAHGLSINSALSEIQIYENRMYTADTIGYVREWEIIEGSDELIPHAIQKCARDEITGFDICHNGEFFVTTSIDMSARLWHGGDMAYVGLFNNSNTWNINDPSTWAKDVPFIKEVKHFQSHKQTQKMFTSLKKGVEMMQSMRSMRSFASMKRMPKVSAEPQPEAKDDENKPVDFELIGKTINDYINSQTYEEAYQITSKPYLPEIPVASRNISILPHELQLTSRPGDLVSKIHTLIRPQTTIAKSREVERHTLKIPPKKSTAMRSCRIPVALSL